MNSATAAPAVPLLPMRPLSPAPHGKRLVIVSAVVGMHVLGLWAMQSGLLARVVEIVVPVQVMAELIEAPQPEIPPAPPAPKPEPVVNKPQPVVKPKPQPVPFPIPAPVVAEPAVITAPEVPPPVAQAPTPAPAASPAPAPEPAPARIELPSSDADYLNNPLPPYPPLSRRLGEQGTVLVRVHIDQEGNPTHAEVKTSSGYERLDQTALQTARRWRYKPGKQNGVPIAMALEVPISFQLSTIK
jgi:protein TonB